MKHEEISLNTKRTLAEALKRAMSRKPFQKITVSELVRDSDVNRKTFYYHFDDIYALLKWMLEEEAIEVLKHFDLLSDYEEAITFVMDYIEENDYIINCAFDSIGRDELKRFFYAGFLEIIASVVEREEEKFGICLEKGYRDFLTYFYMEALAGMLIDWVRDREKRDREAVTRYLSAAMRDSLGGIFAAQGSAGRRQSQEARSFSEIPE